MGAKLTEQELELAMREIGKMVLERYRSMSFCVDHEYTKGKVAAALSISCERFTGKAVPPRSVGGQKWFYGVCIALAVCWAIVVICSSLVDNDVEPKFLPRWIKENTTLATI